MREEPEGFSSMSFAFGKFLSMMLFLQIVAFVHALLIVIPSSMYFKGNLYSYFFNASLVYLHLAVISFVFGWFFPVRGDKYAIACHVIVGAFLAGFFPEYVDMVCDYEVIKFLAEFSPSAHMLRFLIFEEVESLTSAEFKPERDKLTWMRRFGIPENVDDNVLSLVKTIVLEVWIFSIVPCHVFYLSWS